MCARIYLDGDGIGKGTHVSVFFLLMRGTHDALLHWPFRQMVTFKLVDQSGSGGDIVDSFRPDPTSNSFRKPTSDMNVASGCPMFMPISDLDSPYNSFVVDDVAFVEIRVDTSNLE